MKGVVSMAQKDHRKEYEDYFKEILDGLDAEFENSQKYSVIINKEIEKFTQFANLKGGQHYLTEHIKNAVALQSQRQSLYKDKFAIKKTILDFTFKEGDEGSDQNLFKELQKLVENGKKKIEAINQKNEKITIKIEKDEEDLNKEIDAELGEFTELVDE